MTKNRSPKANGIVTVALIVAPAILFGNCKISSIIRITKNLSIIIDTVDSCTCIINLLIRRSLKTFQKNISFLLMKEINIFCQDSRNSGFRYMNANIFQKFMNFGL